jgi:hypothetical protein
MNRRLARVAHACARCMTVLLPVTTALLILFDILLVCGVKP